METRSHAAAAELSPAEPAAAAAPKPRHPAAGRRRRTAAARGWHGLTPEQAYTALGLAHLALAVPLAFAGRAAAKLAFGHAADPVEDQHVQLLGLYASGLATSAAMAFALGEAARRRMLGSFTADVLKLGLISHSAAWAALALLHLLSLGAAAWAVEAGAAAATAALPASHLLARRDDRARLRRDLRRAPAAARGLLRLGGAGRDAGGGVRSFAAALYTALGLATPAAGLLYVLFPHWTLVHTFGYDYGKSAHAAWRAIGGGALATLLPAALLTLREAARGDALHAPIPRTLNLGLMGTAAGHLMVLGPVLAKAHGGWLTPLLAAHWGGALVAAMLGLSAPELEALVEEVGAETVGAAEE